MLRALLERELGRAEALRPALLDDATQPPHERLRAAVDWHLDVHARYPRHREAFAGLAASALPAHERQRLRRARAEDRGELRAGAPRGARNARVVTIAGDHFDVYSPPVQGHAAELAAVFLAEHLAP